MAKQLWQLGIFWGSLVLFVRAHPTPDGKGMYTAEGDYLRIETGVPPESRKRAYTSIIERPGNSVETHNCGQVTSVPAKLRKPENMYPNGLHQFYQKYTHAYGIPVVGSRQVSDSGLQRMCYLIRFLLADRPDVRECFYKMFGRYGLMSVEEQTVDIPEHSHMEPIFWNQRARGLGGTRQSPVSTGGEENALCLKNDRYPGEDIVLHELVHGVHLLGAQYAIEGFDKRLKELYNWAKARGLWANTYAMTNHVEYWRGRIPILCRGFPSPPIALYMYKAIRENPCVGEWNTSTSLHQNGCRSKTTELIQAEVVQSYFNDNDVAVPTNGIHNDIWNREKLRGYDPEVYKLIEEIWPCKNTFLHRCFTSRELEQSQQLKMNCKGTDNKAFAYDASCTDSDFGCPDWFSMGECTNNPAFMLARCQRSCKQCTSTYRGTANSGYQSNTQPLNTCENDNMCNNQACNNPWESGAKHCRKKCVNCGFYQQFRSTSSSACSDNNQSCSFWASIGECTNNPGYMLPNCKKSCNSC